MSEAPKKVVVIGLDCALPHLIEKHIAEGYLPTFKKLIDKGVIADNCLVPYPTITPPNWATIGTGAWPGTHCVTDFHVKMPGAPLDNYQIQAAFNSERVKAEFIWDALDKTGKKCIVLNYPGAWPSHMKNGIVVGGTGLSVNENRDGMRGMGSKAALTHDLLLTTGVYPGAIRGEFVEAEDWGNVPDIGEDPMEMEAELSFPGTLKAMAPATWYVLVRNTGGNGYDQATLSPTKDFNDAFCTLAVGKWSPKVFTKMKLADGSESEAYFRCKLLELSDDAEDFRLFISSITETTGWSSPEVAGQIVSEEGIFAPGGGIRGYRTGWHDIDTYLEINEMYSEWLADAATALMTKNEWDAFFMHGHSPDWMYHVLITDMDPNLTPDEATRNKAWEIHLKIYEAQDKMIARILEVAGEDNLVITVSDHGATPDGTPFDPYKALVPAGLTVLAEKQEGSKMLELLGKSSTADEVRAAAQKPEASKSKAVPQRSCHIYVNLKGRDPDGIVEPEDYEKVQLEIIDALYQHVNEETGKRPVALALTKQDARIIGLHGDSVGDVIYALYPWFGGQHGHILPTAEWGPGSLKGLLTFTGPGIKEGHRLQRTAWLTDIVPTICYLMDYPLPAEVEGSVLYQVFGDPNFKMKLISELRDAVAKK